MQNEQQIPSERVIPKNRRNPDARCGKTPDWARRSDEDLLRYIFVCPHASPEVDDLLLR